MITSQIEDWIYLDYNASTPMAEEVWEAMKETLQAQGHASSPHPHGRAAAAAVARARTQVADVLGCSEEEIVFCSGSTEASNHVVKGIGFRADNFGKELHFISSVVDHAATLEPLKFMQKLGHQVTLLEVDRYGRFSSKDLKNALRPNTVLVTLIHGQNEIGTVQPLEEIGLVCQEAGVPFHVDASQSFGKIPFQVRTLRASFLNIAGHKIYGPKGVGALFVAQDQELEPLLHGGGHENGWRSGTPAPQLVAGLGAACALVSRSGSFTEEAATILWDTLKQELGDKVRRNGHPIHRLPNVLHLTFQNVSGRELLDAAKVSASTGAACHSATISPVLQALNCTPQEAVGSVRLSCGRNTSLESVHKAGLALAQAYRRMTT